MLAESLVKRWERRTRLEATMGSYSTDLLNYDSIPIIWCILMPADPNDKLFKGEDTSSVLEMRHS